MADYYTQFSVLLPHAKDDEDGKKAAEWFEETRFQTTGEDSIEYQDLVNMEMVSSDCKVWLYGDDDASDLEAAIELIQKYLTDLGIEGGVFMSWGSWCSKPRVNEAMGGAFIITKDDLLQVNSYDLLQEEGVEILNIEEG